MGRPRSCQQRASLLYKLADLIEKYSKEELAALEALENGKKGLTLAGRIKSTGRLSSFEDLFSYTSRLVEKVRQNSKHERKSAQHHTWGVHAPATKRTSLLYKLADLMEKHKEELAALEALENGKKRSYAGWADKIHGKIIKTSDEKLTYTRHEPIGVVGQIIPWNFPLLMLTWKIGPPLAIGNSIVMKLSEFTPLTAIRICSLVSEAGFPPGVFNVVTGYGFTAGVAVSRIDKVAFTGSTLVGREIMEATTKRNLNKVTLEESMQASQKSLEIRN